MKKISFKRIGIIALAVIIVLIALRFIFYRETLWIGLALLLAGLIAFLVWKAFVKNGREDLRRSERKGKELEEEVTSLKKEIAGLYRELEEKGRSPLNVVELSPILHLAVMNIDSSFVRTFIREGLWQQVYESLQPGDFVTIQFGHNDICPITDAKARGVIPGTKDTLHVYKLDNGTYEVVYSFGWYLKKMIDDVREKGATPILVSLTPRNEWPDGRIERRDGSYGKWYREVVEETGVEFIDLHNLSADFLDKKFAVKKLSDDKEKAKAQVAQIKEKAGVYFKKDHTHASKLGAQMNAQSFAKGLKASGSELSKFLKK